MAFYNPRRPAGASGRGLRPAARRAAPGRRRGGADRRPGRRPIRTPCSHAKPQAVLVALEPAVEDALDRFDGAAVAIPAITVIFDEAELAAHREGWDAARWARHLAAKLHRHDDVLPPGSEAQIDWPDPGPLPPPRADIGELDIAAFTGEALERAADVPRDEGFDNAIDGVFADDGRDDVDARDETPRCASTPRASCPRRTWTGPRPPATTVRRTPACCRSTARLQTTTNSPHCWPIPAKTMAMRSGCATRPRRFQPRASAIRCRWPTRMRRSPRHRRAGSASNAIWTNSTAASRASRSPTPTATVTVRCVAPCWSRPASAVPMPCASCSRTSPSPFRARSSCACSSTAAATTSWSSRWRARRSCRWRLPWPSEPADAGNVYVLPPTMTVLRDRARLVFAEADVAHAAHALYAELPPNDSAVLFLSGSDPALVDIAMGLAPDGALVAAQSPDRLLRRRGVLDADRARRHRRGAGGARREPRRTLAVLTERLLISRAA